LGERREPSTVLQALTSRNDGEARVAEVYVGDRPIADVAELRVVASGITRMTESGPQVRAVDALARHEPVSPEFPNGNDIIDILIRRLRSP
jgi:hypothetical protein